MPSCPFLSIYKISAKIALDTRHPFGVNATRSFKNSTNPPAAYRRNFCSCSPCSQLHGIPFRNRNPNRICSSLVQGLSSSNAVGWVAAAQNACKSDGT